MGKEKQRFGIIVGHVVKEEFLMTEELYRPWLWKVPEGSSLGKHVPVKDGYAKVSVGKDCTQGTFFVLGCYMQNFYFHHIRTQR